MKRTLAHPLFLASVVLATANQLLEMGGVFLPVIHSYLDDLLCLPIVLTLGLASYRFFWPNYLLTPWHIWLVVAVYSIYFEAYLPTISGVYTRDFLDVLAYIVGAMIFNHLVNRAPKREVAVV